MNEQILTLKFSTYEVELQISCGFAPKYRRKVFFQDKREEIRDIIKILCQWKGVDILEGEICPEIIFTLTIISLPK